MEINSILQTMPLFDHIQQNHYQDVLHYLKSHTKKYKKSEIICGIHEPLLNAGIVLSGKVRVSFVNRGGSEHNVRQAEKGEFFGGALVCAVEEKSEVQIIALQKSEIMFLDLSELFTEKARICPYALQVTQNLLRQVAKKNIFLYNKVEILAQRKIRDRIYIYLKNRIKSNDSIINLPLSRQELANYLGVDRSALSRELCTMKDEGILTFNRNKITILKPEMLLWRGNLQQENG